MTAQEIRPMPPLPSAPAPLRTAEPPLLLLGRALLWRLGAVVVVVLALLAWSDWRDWRRQLAADLPATAALATQLLNDDLARRAGAFNRTQLTVTLAALQPLARRAAFCAELRDLQGRMMDAGCLPGPSAPMADPSAAPSTPTARLAHRLAGGGADDWLQRHTLVLPEGLKLGTAEIVPDWDHEGRQLGHRWALLAAAGATLIGVLVLASWGVARALAPANQILGALARLAGGDTGVRLPPMRLRELHHIAHGFNEVAGQWESTRQQQRQLAAHLLQAREAERRHLARELHDELGQSLSALQAEAAAIELMSSGPADGSPRIAASAQAMRRTLGQTLDGLQRVLSDLRPQALDRFGLPAALQALAAQPRRRPDGSALQVRLHLSQPWPALPADHDIHVYRIVQEALTNALRHSDAAHATVELTHDAAGLRLHLHDDGRTHAARPLRPGHGLLGLRERVAALGGDVHWTQPADGGLHLQVRLPPADPATPSDPDDKETSE